MVLYNMRYVPQSFQLNPGQIPYMKWHIGMPALSSIRAGVGSTGFDFNRIDTQIEAEESTYSMLISPSAPEFNRGLFDLELQLLNFGFQFNGGRSYLSFDVSETVYASGNYTADLARMFDQIENNELQGAGSMIFDQSRQDFNLAYYRGFGVGYAHQVNSRLSIGVRARYLQGILNLWTENQGLRFNYPGDGRNFDVEGRLNILTAGRTLVEEVDGVSSLFPAGNGGFSIDLGGVYRANDKWEFSFAMQQLGQITWREDVNYTVVGDQLTFSAVDIDDHFDTWASVADSLLDGQGINTNVSYSTPLPQRYFIGANYFFSPNSSVGLLINPISYHKATDLNLALALQTRLGKILGLSVVAGHSRYADFNLGTGLSIELGNFQVYALTEALLGGANWRSAEMAHAQLGINLNFGRYKRSDKLLPEAEEMPTEVAIVKPEPKRRSRKESREEPPVRQEPVSIAPPKKVAQRETPEKTETNSAVAEDLRLSHVTPGYYQFSASIANLQSGLWVERARYEVFTMDADGQRSLLLIGSVMNGKLSVELAVDQMHVLKLTAKGYQDQEVVLRKVGSQQSQQEIQKGIRLVPEPPASTTPKPIYEEQEPVTVPKPEPKVRPEPTPPAREVTPSKPVEKPAETTEAPPSPSERILPRFMLSKSTSLRKEATHESGVILRLRTGDQVEVLEKTNRFWWKVRFGQQVGFAKASLMDKL